MPRVLFVVSEYFPYIKTGGLADAAASLAMSLRNAGIDVQVMLPAYSQLRKGRFRRLRAIKLPPLPEIDHLQLVNYIDVESGMPLWLVECPEVYDVEGGIYAGTGHDPEHQVAQRFGVLAWAAAQLAAGKLAVWTPDIVHMHDWHASLASVYLDRLGCGAPRTLLTIHNLAFQGVFRKSTLHALGLDHHDLAWRGSHDDQAFSFLGEAIARCDKITTVSPNYAKEIMTPEYGCGLDHLLRQREPDVFGILNGVDYQTWCPELDPHLPIKTSRFDAAARLQCRRMLQSDLGLEVTQRTPIIAFTNRITEQKMADTLLDSISTLMERDLQLIVHGKGDTYFEKALTAIAERYPNKFVARIGHSQRLEHLIHAGSDICLSPSRFEPCGLNPLYAVRYGAVPVVRAVGGIVDSIVDTNDITLAKGNANGFTFTGLGVLDMIKAIDKALHYYFNERELWQRIVSNGIRRQYKWHDAANKYIDIYRNLKSRGEDLIKNEELAKIA